MSNNLPLADFLKAKIQEELTEGMTIKLLAEPMYDCFIVTRKKGELITKKLVSYHRKSDGSEAKFEIRQESDGSQRIIHLLPTFLELASMGSKKVFVVDELDRSLHTNLTRGVLEFYLSNCSVDTRSQLLFTTHDIQLMDQKLFRRDEMWATERELSGTSLLIPFSDYKEIRYDKDIRKSYLQGRLGGIPQIDYSLSLDNCSVDNS